MSDFAVVLCRFSGKERLPCNCGASNCRGFVNRSVSNEEDILIARSKLQILQTRQAPC